MFWRATRIILDVQLHRGLIGFEDAVERLIAETGFERPAAVAEVKRYTGLGTGPCQGKECMVSVALLCQRATGQDPRAIGPFTSRPPVEPAPLGIFAAAPSPSAESEES